MARKVHDVCRHFRLCGRGGGVCALGRRCVRFGNFGTLTGFLVCRGRGRTTRPSVGHSRGGAATRRSAKRGPLSGALRRMPPGGQARSWLCRGVVRARARSRRLSVSRRSAPRSGGSFPTCASCADRRLGCGAAAIVGLVSSNGRQHARCCPEFWMTDGLSTFGDHSQARRHISRIRRENQTKPSHERLVGQWTWRTSASQLQVADGTCEHR